MENISFLERYNHYCFPNYPQKLCYSFCFIIQSGHEPAVRVWDVEDRTHPQVSEMPKGHKHGIQCVVCYFIRV